MGIRDFLKQHDSRFLSVKEVLEGVAQAENVKVSEVARAFSLRSVLITARPFMRSDIDGKFKNSLDFAHKWMIENEATEGNGEYFDGLDDLLASGDPGWMRGDVVAALDKAGIAVPDAWRVEEEAIDHSHWVYSFVGRDQITVKEAAYLLCGESPCGSDCLSPKKMEEVRAWKAALLDASGNVIESYGGLDQAEQLLSHEDIRAWCEKNGHFWPVPYPPGYFGVHESFEVRRLREEIEMLKATVIGYKTGFFPVETPDEPSENVSGCVVKLPHMNKALAAVFKIMADNWESYDPKRKPKQVNIAREIDVALGWGDPDDSSKGPSRNAKVIAMIIQPDEVGDTE